MSCSTKVEQVLFLEIVLKKNSWDCEDIVGVNEFGNSFFFGSRWWRLAVFFNIPPPSLRER